MSSQNPDISKTVMAAKEFCRLLDSYWFEHGIFTRKPIAVPQETNPVLEIQEEFHEPKLSSLTGLHVRSYSDQALSCKTSFSSDSFSPSSTLTTPPKLQTILSGKEVGDFASDSFKQEEKEIEVTEVSAKRKIILERRRRRRRKESSKSSSDLEFEELKGFMDLGFVFSEEDKDSSLVSILPGLQRLKRNSASGQNNVHEQDWINEPIISRPYLSEAWDVLEQRKVENSLTNWRIPALATEVNMKDHLRFWAHTVASNVR